MDSSSQSPSEPPAAPSSHLPPVSTVPSTTSSVLAPAPSQSSANPNPNTNPNSFQNQNPNSKTSAPLPNQPSQQQQSLSGTQQITRPSATLTGTWQPPSHFSHFSSPSPSATSGPHTTLVSPSSRPVSSQSPAQRGGIAIGVPAHQPSPSPQPAPAPFSTSYGQHFGGLGRGGVSMAEPASNAASPQARPPMQGMQGLGMLGSSGSSSQMLQRPAQTSLRPPSTPNSASQSFQGHGLLRVPSASSPSSSLPSTSQGMQPSNQPWLPSSSQGKPPLPTPSYRPPANSPSLQQRAHIPQQQNHSLATASQQQQISSSPQQQPTQSHQQQEHFAQQFQPPRSSQGLSHQQQAARVQGPANQKASLAPSQTSNTQSMAQSRTITAEIEEPCSRILSKRSICELVNQIDPSEKLDPEVEDILVDLADEFVESITTFGCSLAKHRKSTTLEAKDILLHLEKNWNITLPGFGGDEIKIFRKPATNDTHKERLAAVKKSIVASEMANTRSSAGQATGNTKSSLAKTPAV